MKDLYQIGLGPKRFVSAELRPYHKGWMITRISEPDNAPKAEGLDLKILNMVIIDADNEGVILYLGESIVSRRGAKRYVHLGFQVYSGTPRRRPVYQEKGDSYV